MGIYYSFLYDVLCAIQTHIEKAKTILSRPSKAAKVKFFKTEQAKINLNEELIQKTTKLLGIKGYYTDIEESVANSKAIIERYHEL
jgi:hypothetical protein